MAKDAELSGSLRIRAVIGPTGEQMEPAAVQPGPLLTDPEMIDCITELLPLLNYPAPGPGATAVCLHPILFSPG